MRPNLLMLIVGLFAATLQGQNTMQVKRIAGGNGQFPLATVGKITFTPTDMVVANPNTSIPMADISVITFTDIPVKVAPKIPASRSVKREITLASSASRILVSFSVSAPGAVKVAISDGRGRLIRTLTKYSAAAGMVSIAWDKKDGKGAHVPPGIYMVSIVADGKQSVSHQLVLH